MRRNIKSLCLLLFLIPTPALAQNNGMPTDDFTLMTQAVQYASQADAQNTYCKKESRLSIDFIEKFRDKLNLSKKHQQTLYNLQQKITDETTEILNRTMPDCRDINFTMERFNIMQKLKDVSYRLNGVDPKTVPGPEILDIERLLQAQEL